MKPEVKGAVLALAGVAAVLVGLWIYIGLRLRIWTYNEYGRYVWLIENLPVAHSLWHNKIHAGDDVEQVIRIWRPHMTSRFDHWVELRWFPGGKSEDAISLSGIYVLAKDGKLVSASSYSDDGILNRIFFETLTYQEKSNHETDLHAYVDKLQARKKDSAQQNAATNAAPPHR